MSGTDRWASGGDKGAQVLARLHYTIAHQPQTTRVTAVVSSLRSEQLNPVIIEPLTVKHRQISTSTLDICPSQNHIFLVARLLIFLHSQGTYCCIFT